MKNIIALGAFLFPCLLFAKPELSQLKPLLFQADKNNVQVLPQVFEFALMEDGSIRLGDILIDQSKLNFQISTTSEKQYQLTFRWPSALLREGNLVVKNNIGKAIFTQKIDKDFSSSQRSESAEYTVNISADQVEDMKYSPFMSFCVFREDAETRIYLCSQELYLSQQSGPLTVKSRDESRKKTAQVEINGQLVGNQGYIFLNSAREKIILKAFAAGGSSLEIETRRKDIDLKDVVASEDGKFLLLTASGAEPVDETIVKKLSSTDWQAKLDINRPFIYVKGDGDIPMRQELLVKGPLPSEKDRAYIEAGTNTRTYDSNLNLKVYLPKNTTAKALNKDSKVEVTEPDQIRWSIAGIPTESNVRRYLILKSENKQVIASQDLFRGTPFELGLNLNYFNPSSIAYLGVHFTWWLSLKNLHWGINLNHQMHLTTKLGEAQLDLTTASLLYRFKPGFYLEDEAWGASLNYQTLKTETVSLAMPGVGFFTHQKVSGKWSNWLNLYQLNLKYFLGSSGAGVIKIKSSYAADLTAYRTLSRSLSLNYGLALQQFKFEPAAPKESMDLGLNLGMSYNF